MGRARRRATTVIAISGRSIIISGESSCRFVAINRCRRAGASWSALSIHSWSASISLIEPVDHSCEKMKPSRLLIGLHLKMSRRTWRSAAIKTISSLWPLNWSRVIVLSVAPTSSPFHRRSGEGRLSIRRVHGDI